MKATDQRVRTSLLKRPVTRKWNCLSNTVRTSLGSKLAKYRSNRFLQDQHRRQWVWYKNTVRWARHYYYYKNGGISIKEILTKPVSVQDPNKMCTQTEKTTQEQHNYDNTNDMQSFSDNYWNNTIQGVVEYQESINSEESTINSNSWNYESLINQHFHRNAEFSEYTAALNVNADLYDSNSELDAELNMLSSLSSDSEESSQDDKEIMNLESFETLRAGILKHKPEAKTIFTEAQELTQKEKECEGINTSDEEKTNTSSCEDDNDLPLYALWKKVQNSKEFRPTSPFQPATNYCEEEIHSEKSQDYPSSEDESVEEVQLKVVFLKNLSY